MQVIEMQLEDFFKNSGIPYYNEDEIEFTYDEKESSLLVSGPLPENYEIEDGIAISLVSNHAPLFDFIFEFLITDVSDIETITSEILLKRFLVGRGWLYCYVDPDFKYYLSYLRDGESLFATDPEGNRSEVPAQVQTIEEIIVYTKHFFQSAK
jgi:hypothetical protein